MEERAGKLLRDEPVPNGQAGPGRGQRWSPAYQAVRAKLAAQQCVILDGGIGTELCDVAIGADELLWGTTALLATPASVLSVHRRYVDAGCDVISTDTWALATAIGDDPGVVLPSVRSGHWMDVARQGLRLARQAINEGRRAGEVAVAFSLNSDIDTPGGKETIALLDRVFEQEAPDLILVETLSLLRGSLDETVAALLSTGLPVWLSFRRCLEGLCGVYGQHWGGPEGDEFGRAARRFEEMGVGALLVNCIPPDHVAGIIPWLRGFTDLPLGVYPNLGYLASTGWRFDQEVGGAAYARMALDWREEGAQIIGGCCGVGPAHIAASHQVLAGTTPGTPAQTVPAAPAPAPPATSGHRGWADSLGRPLFPLRLPDLAFEPGVFAPAEPSLLLWRHLFRHRVGAGRRCLDVGCGTGLLAVQLALNGAEHVHAIDLDPRAVPNTIANAYRNGVGEIVTAAVADLYPWVPDERYDVIVASLFQCPVNPDELASTHRPLDYWGRSLLDHLIVRLPEALAPDGVAYVVQLSVVGMERTLALLDAHGLASRIMDYGFCPMPAPLQERRDHVERVEALSDAYHLKLGTAEILVAYVVEITRAIGP